MESVDAIVIQNGKKCEARCRKCGKLLFILKNYSKNFEKPLDKSSQNVIIVSRCTRNDCKADNLLYLS